MTPVFVGRPGTTRAATVVILLPDGVREKRAVPRPNTQLWLVSQTLVPHGLEVAARGRRCVSQGQTVEWGLVLAGGRRDACWHVPVPVGFPLLGTGAPPGQSKQESPPTL